MNTTASTNTAESPKDAGPKKARKPRTTRQATSAVLQGVRGTVTVSPEIVKAQEAFFNTRISHPAMKELQSDLLPLLLPHSETNVIIVTGATGVGKSTFSTKMLTKLLADFAPLAAADTSSVPLVAVEAYSNGEDRASFNDLFHDIAAKLSEPAMAVKTDVLEIDGRLIAQPHGRTKVGSLRKVVEHGLRMRKTRVLVIDEAAHLLRLDRDTAPMDTLKSIANTCGVKLVLVGSFDLLDMVESHGQIARRTSVLLLDRYHRESEADKKAFKTVLGHLMAHWPCEQVPNFVAVSDALLDASLGCVGLLKSLLLDASAFQLLNHGEWDPSFLVKAAKANLLHRTIRDEIALGEAKVRDAILGTSIWTDEVLEKVTLKVEA